MATPTHKPAVHKNVVATSTTNPQSGPRITQLTQFDTRIRGFEQQYGVQLATNIRRNVNSQNGELNQWIGEVWYLNASTKLSITPAMSVDFPQMLNMLLDNVTLMLRQHAGQRKAA